MLSLWKLRVGAEDYYLDQVAKGLDDYYSGAGETRGNWIGAASSALGLDAEVDGDDLRAILAGLAPGTGLTPNGDQVRTSKNRVPGFDLTFSAPKSVSILYALGDPLVRSEVIAATNAAVQEALAWLEREACYVRRGSNNRAAKAPAFEQWGTRRLPGRGFIAAQFRHRTSRLGDPQLHSHVLVANVTQGPDGKWSALDGQALYRSKMAAGALYRSVLRNELSKWLGVEWNPTRDGLSDIAGIPAKVVRAFSKRRDEIETELDRTGRSGAGAAAQATLDTRTTKSDIDQTTLDGRWLAEAEQIGFGPADIDQLLANGRGRDIAAAGERPLTDDTLITVRRRDSNGEVIEELVTIDGFARAIGSELPLTDATVTRHDVQNAVASLLSSNGSAPLLERLTDAVLAHPELIPLPIIDDHDKGWEQTWTTRTLVDAEAELAAYFNPHRPRMAALDPAFVASTLDRLGHTLGSDQLDTVRRVTTQGLAVEAVVGKAGTGKTYTMNAVRQVFQAAGYQVIGAAPTGRAARELSEGAGIESTTIANLLWHKNLPAGGVVIIDEAAMVDTLTFARLMRAIDAHGAKAIVVGDHHQLPEIDAGGSFKALLDAIGDQRSELTINRRQRHAWEHPALDHLRHGDVNEFWKAYLDHGRVVVGRDQTEVQTRAVRDWFAAYRNGSNAYMLAGTRAEARLLNDLSRRLADAAGMLSGKALEVRGRPYQVGDRILLTRNNRYQIDLDTGGKTSVDNGMIGTIVSINHRRRRRSIDIRLLNGRHVRLDREYLRDGYITHGYASTFHKAQGLTCDDVFVVGPAGMYRESGYVALSRARNEAHLYATTKEAAALGERDHSTGLPLPTERVDDPHADMIGTLHQSKAKQFATAQQPHLAAIADAAHSHTIGELEARRRHINTVAATVRRDGHTDPTAAVARLAAAVEHRSVMHVGGRVNAADWDNVGTITHIVDTCGAAHVRFISSDGQRSATKMFTWDEITPVDHPEPAEITPDAATYFAELDEVLAGQLDDWRDALEHHGVDPTELELVPAAIDQRRHQLLHNLRATPPAWLRWWVGDRPVDPVGATVYDDHLAELAAWRDTHHIDRDVAGYGPQPADPTDADQWRQLLDNALATRTWLANHQPHLHNHTPSPILLDAARQRLDELDQLLATAPPDMDRIIADITDNPHLDDNERLARLTAAAARQQVRADWILEHWPNVIEHQQLTALTADIDPLAHWPTPLDPDAQYLHSVLVATSVDADEPRSLDDLDDARAAAQPIHQVRGLQRELDTNLTQIAQLNDEPAPEPAHAELAAQHIARLRERNQQLRDQIRDIQMAQRFVEWGTSATPELDTAIDAAVTRLAHHAITTHEPWVAETVRHAHHTNPAITLDELRQLVHDVAAYRERTGHTGPDPIGPEPESDHPHVAAYSDLDARLDIEMEPQVDVDVGPF